MDEQARLQAFLDQRLRGRYRLQVLDAGCGRALHVDLGEDPRVTGIDLAAEALAENKSLNDRIVGDIQTHQLDRGSFDVVVCWDVLEHLARPGLALENLAGALRPGGLLVIAGPNPMSLKGLATKLTPLPLHRFAYRRMGSKESPFPTFLRLSAAPLRIIEWARSPDHGLLVEHLGFYEAPIQVALRRRMRLTGRAWASLRTLTRACTFGTLDPALTDFLLVLSRPPLARSGVGDSPAVR